VNVDHLPDSVNREVVEPIGLRDTGIVDNDVNPTERIESGANDHLGTFLGRDGGRAADGGPALGFGLLDNLRGRFGGGPCPRSAGPTSEQREAT
jgi:hypothetical protein